MLKVDQNSGNNLGFKSLLSESIVRKNPNRVVNKMASGLEKTYEVARGTKLGNLITEGSVPLAEAEKFLTEQYFAGRTDFIEGVNKTLSKSLVEKIYGIK